MGFDPVNGHTGPYQLTHQWRPHDRKFGKDTNSASTAAIIKRMGLGFSLNCNDLRENNLQSQLLIHTKKLPIHFKVFVEHSKPP